MSPEEPLPAANQSRGPNRTKFIRRVSDSELAMLSFAVSSAHHNESKRLPTTSDYDSR